MLTKDQGRKCSSVTLLSTLDCSSNPVHSIAISSDGESVASLSAGGTIKLWDFHGAIQQTFQGHSGSIVTFSPDSSLLVSVSEDTPIQFRNVANGTVSQELQVDSDFDCVTFSTNGELVLAFGDQVHICHKANGTWSQHTFKRYEVPYVPRRDKAPYRMLDGFPHIKTLAFSPQGFIACGYDDGMIKLWEISTGGAYYLEGHLDEVVALAFSSDGAMMASVPRDRSVWLWQVEKACDKPHGHKLKSKELGVRLAIPQFDAAGTIHALSFSDSSRSIRAGVIDSQKQGPYTVSIYGLHCLLKWEKSAQAANVMPSSISTLTGGKVAFHQYQRAVEKRFTYTAYKETSFTRRYDHRQI